MLKYIDMPKLVAFYLREFSVRGDGETSTLYKFIFCLCLPFISATFRRARLIALAIAECTNSQDQIVRLLEKITGVTVEITPLNNQFLMPYEWGETSTPNMPYSGSENPIMPYEPVSNAGIMNITLNGASKEEVSAYLELLIPFYVSLTINFN